MDRKAVLVLLCIPLFMIGQVPLATSITTNDIQQTEVLQPDDVHSSKKDTIPWGIDRVNATKAWDVTTGSDEIVVAVIDSGIDLTHPDLKDNIWVNEEEVPGNGEDDDFNGFDDDVNGWNFVDETNDIQDVGGHGTHVAGTIAASLNDYGLVGVAPDVKIMPLRVFNEEGSDITSIGEAIIYATRNGADIISMSLGTPSNLPSLGLDTAVEFAREQGVVLVAAAGNDNKNMDDFPFYPASIPGVVAVSATNEKDNRADFSNFGRVINIAAPGVNVNSTYIQGEGASSELLIDDEEMEHFPMLGAAGTNSSGVEAELEFLGLASDEEVQGKDLTGKIALIKRGTYTFKEKIENAASTGAIGAIVFNNVEGLFAGTLQGQQDIPAVSISKANGEAILTQLNNDETVTANIKILYGTNHVLLQGTSMAAPHVSGVLSLIWSADTELTDKEVTGIMYRSAEDIGEPGRDNKFGHGIPDVNLAVQSVSDTEDPIVDHDISVSQNNNGTLTVSGTISAQDNFALYRAGYDFNKSKVKDYQLADNWQKAVNMEFSFLLEEGTDSFEMNVTSTDVRGNQVIKEVNLTGDLQELLSETENTSFPSAIFTLASVFVATYVIRSKNKLKSKTR